MPHNDKIITGLPYSKKVMAEEVLHKNPTAKILPTQPAPDELPTCDHMIEILHKTCGEVAFYYTHVPQTGEMMVSTHARTKSGDTIERNAHMTCGSCGGNVGMDQMQVRRRDMEAANHGKN